MDAITWEDVKNILGTSTRRGEGGQTPQTLCKQVVVFLYVFP